MEHLWSLAGATGGNRSQMGEPRKWLKQTDWQPMATHGNSFGAHGKEGVDGSSPSEGCAKGCTSSIFPFRSISLAWNVRWVWSLGWSLQRRNSPGEGPGLVAASGTNCVRP